MPSKPLAELSHVHPVSDLPVRLHTASRQSRLGVTSVEVLPLLRAIVDDANEILSCEGRRVRARLDAQAFTLPSDLSMPLLLLVREAVANACSHAFPNYAAGIIRVAMKIETNNVLVVRIADDGIGMPTPQIDGYGRRMMRAAADRLSAPLTFEVPGDGVGTSVVLEMRVSQVCCSDRS